MIKVILLIIAFVLLYTVGRIKGEKETLERIKEYIKNSNNWNEFMEQISIDFKANDIKEWIQWI